MVGKKDRFVFVFTSISAEEGADEGPDRFSTSRVRVLLFFPLTFVIIQFFILTDNIISVLLGK